MIIINSKKTNEHFNSIKHMIYYILKIKIKHKHEKYMKNTPFIFIILSSPLPLPMIKGG
jgi:hypothetical protein